MISKAKFSIIFELFGNFCKNIWHSFYKFLRRIVLSIKIMPLWEQATVVILLVVALSVGAKKISDFYYDHTVAMPDDGGIYSEVIAGQVNTLNPILAQTDAERSISGLIFSSLVKVNDAGKIVADVADRWEVTNQERTYTFYIKQGIRFHDGNPLTADDVVYTVQNIQSADLKSPLAGIWQNVTVRKGDDDNIVVFDLPTSYGPFILNCDFGIMPAHLDSATFSKKFVGSGPYKFVKAQQNGSLVSQIKLQKNTDYYAQVPYIDEANFTMVDSDSKAVSSYQKGSSLNAIFEANGASGTDYSYDSAKSMMLVLNTRSDKLKDIAIRKLVLAHEKMETKISLNLVASDSDIARSTVGDILKNYEQKNIELNIKYLSSTQYSQAIADKSFDLILYGTSNGNDRDPYPFWHSSQLSAKNFAGFSDKSLDIAIEDARMILDYNDRNAKYAQIYQTISNQSLVEFFNPLIYHFFVKTSVKGVTVSAGLSPASRFENIANWYIKEKRARK
jgi:ABC-type transport system substrate-binding protein